MFINDPKRTFVDVGAALIWLGLDPDDMEPMNTRRYEIESCSRYLCNAAEMGALNYYNKKVFQSIEQPGLDEPIKIYQYTFSLQDLINFAKIKNHKLVLLDGKAKSDTPIGVEKPLSTTERNTLLTIIAALCDYSAIKHQERGAASQIARLTEEIGTSVSADTVKRALEKIPDALDARMK